MVHDDITWFSLYLFVFILVQQTQFVRYTMRSLRFFYHLGHTIFEIRPACTSLPHSLCAKHIPSLQHSRLHNQTIFTRHTPLQDTHHSTTIFTTQRPFLQHSDHLYKTHTMRMVIKTAFLLPFLQHSYHLSKTHAMGMVIKMPFCMCSLTIECVLLL